MFRLEELWPENNSRKVLRFTFGDGTCTVSQMKGGLPGQPLQEFVTAAVKEV